MLVLSRKKNVFYPLMPKGVEHIGLREATAEDSIVFYPLMPKGVEHGLPGTVLSDCHVFYPLMPKGVEHNQYIFRLTIRNKCVLSVDAERR